MRLVGQISIEQAKDSVGDYLKVKCKHDLDDNSAIMWLDDQGCQLTIINDGDISGIDTTNHRIRILGVDIL